MTESLLLHPTTHYQLAALLQSKPHAVLISGLEGSGKNSIAFRFTSDVFGSKPILNNPYFLHISPSNSGVGIEEVRKIRDFLSRKTTGTSKIRRVVLVSEAHTMNSEAQNAMLKTLEEPPEDTMVILTASDPTALMQTIRSRTQQLIVLPVDLLASEVFFKSAGFSEQETKTAYYISDGRVGLLKAILDGSGDHELVVAIADAKTLLKADTYERLTRVDSLTKEKDKLALLLQGLERVVMSGLRMSAEKKDEKSVRRLYKLGQSIQLARTAIDRNVNTKLVLTDLFMSM